MYSFRIKFESLSTDLIGQCMDIVHDLLKSKNFSKDKIDKVRVTRQHPVRYTRHL